jgi:general stress protein YciG
MQKDGQREGDLTMREIGRKGGLTCLANNGPDHYRRIGRQGGRKVRGMVPSGEAKKR